MTYMLVIFTNNRNKIIKTDSLVEALDWWKENKGDHYV